ncbi:zinc finger protein 595-like [Sitodiplosis mosellana]|uniref:zinc finger protein 595-like n=1 Tax=Sitodiplosis mosellana TaxID=263140 RepID=UPI002444536E|nr:zinc finger protein 595-like [Sitodiplosis mosellana]
MCFTIDQYEQACGFLLLSEFNTFIYCCKRCHCEFDSGPNLEVHILSEHEHDKAYIGNGFVDDDIIVDVGGQELNEFLATEEVLIDGEPVDVKAEESFKISAAFESNVNDDDFGNDLEMISTANESVVAIDVPLVNRTKRAENMNVLDQNVKKPNPMDSGQKSQSSNQKSKISAGTSKNSDKISNTSKNISTTKIPMISRIVKAFHGRASNETPVILSTLVQGYGLTNTKGTTSESTHNLPPVFYCEHCPGGFFTVKQKLRQHMKTHVNALRRKMCPIRKKNSIQIPMISQIVKACRGRASIKTPVFPPASIQESESKKPKETTSESTPDLPPIFYCEHCPGRIFTVKAKLRQHMETHVNALRRKICPICNRKPINYDKHMRTFHGEVGPHKCDSCPKSFQYKSGLVYHMQKHATEKLFLCEICGKSFQTSALLGGHVRIKHEQKKNHACHYCSKSFCSPASLKEHTNSVDLKLRPFDCDICGKKFNTRRSVRLHKITHGEPLLPCRFCDKMFKLRENRLKHQKRIHGTTISVDLIWRN